MPRIARLLRTEEQTVYHVMSRTALDGFPLKDKEFVRENFLCFKHLFHTKTDRSPTRVKGLSEMYSLKRLSNV
ncbi:MAG: hypothetical protein PVI90_17140 [Desulfobacteraceae bacterium]|jgi:hypothetical protein